MILFYQEEFTIHFKNMNIAVVGAGFAGLAFAWYYSLLNPSDTLTVFDPKPISKRASSLAFLLHPFIHPKSKLNWEGWNAFDEAEKLLIEASKFTDEPFYLKRPFLKLANDPALIAPYQKASEAHPEISWSETTDFAFPGIWIHRAYQLRSDLYLKALERGCSSTGVQFSSKVFDSPDQFDRVVLAKGNQVTENFDFSFSKIKGQVIKIRWPSKNFKLPHAVTAHKCHLVPSFDAKTLMIGSTYEREFTSEAPDQEEALKRLLPRLKGICPEFDQKDILEVSSGIRLNSPNRLPLLGRIDEKTWLFSALGSKGLLYHAYLGCKLADAFCNQSPKSLPEELLI